MKYKTLFRLAVKAIGLLLFTFGVPNLVIVVGLVLESRAAGTTYFTPGLLSQIGSLAVIIGLGAYLVFGGEWIVNLAIPGNRPYCPECAYDLTGAAEPRCPECGTPFRWEDVRPKNEVRSSKSKVDQ